MRVMRPRTLSSTKKFLPVSSLIRVIICRISTLRKLRWMVPSVWLPLGAGCCATCRIPWRGGAASAVARNVLWPSLTLIAIISRVHISPTSRHMYLRIEPPQKNVREHPALSHLLCECSMRSPIGAVHMHHPTEKSGPSHPRLHCPETGSILAADHR